MRLLGKEMHITIVQKHKDIEIQNAETQLIHEHVIASQTHSDQHKGNIHIGIILQASRYTLM